MSNGNQNTIKEVLNGIRKFINILYFTVTDKFICSSVKINSAGSRKKNLILKLDAIGDYILFRAFMLRLAETNPEEQFLVVTNISCKDLIDKTDATIANLEFYYVPREKFHLSYARRKKVLQDLIPQRYDKVINASYSRHYLSDLLVKACGANIKIGQQGDANNIKKWAKGIADKFYDHLIQTPDDIIFEFQRNELFFKELLQRFFNVPETNFKAYFHAIPTARLQGPSASIVVGISAADKQREWKQDNYCAIVEWLRGLGHTVMITGNPPLAEGEDHFKKFASDTGVLDLRGKTSLSELCGAINNSRLLISNETGNVHVAAMLDKKCVCISNGNHFGRFHPYPDDLCKNLKYIYPKEISGKLEDPIYLKQQYGKISRLDINTITIAEVMDAISTLLAADAK